MELKKDTTENVKFAYENEAMPNPNDSLFGNPGMNLGNSVTDFSSGSDSNYGGTPPRKSGFPSWILIACAVVALAVIGLFVVKLVNKKSLDGAYIMSKAKIDGVEYSVEQLETASGMTFYIRLEIDGDEGYMVMSYAGMVEDGAVDIEIDGDNINVSREGEQLTFKYDKKNDELSYELNGTSIIFERIQ